MAKNNIFTHTLPNGLRIVHEQRPSKVGYCGVVVKAGSRNETLDVFGLAHFVEHTIFKGTKRRKSWHILNRMEGVGGELNAFTTKEETTIYSAFPAGNYQRAIDLIADLVTNSLFPTSEIEREREVVADEIDSYRDQPAEAVYDDFEDMIFEGCGLGHNILGTEASLQNLHTNECKTFLNTYYRPDNMVFFSYGDISFAHLCRLVERNFIFSNIEKIERVTDTAQTIASPFHTVVELENHQSHTIYGTSIFGRGDERIPAVTLFNNILGGPGMNSLLNLALREKRGYVYTVESSCTFYEDTGLLAIYFGCDHHHVQPCLKLINRTLDTIIDGKFSERALEASKKQFIGQMLVASENTENNALSLGKSMLNIGRIRSVEEVAERIRAVQISDVRALAEHLRTNASILTLK